MSNEIEHFSADEQQSWAPFYQLSNPDEHFILNEQASWALAFEISKRVLRFLLVEHKFLDEQATQMW